MTSFIAAGGSGRSASVIPAVPAAWSVTTIAFILDTSLYQSSLSDDVAMGAYHIGIHPAEWKGRAGSSGLASSLRRVPGRPCGTVAGPWA